MSAPKSSIDQQWIDEQMAYFPPGSADGIVAMMRAFDRAHSRRQTSSERKGGKAA